MLGRIRDTYRQLFQRLLDNMVDIQAEYKFRTKECKDKYDQTRMMMDAQLEDLQSRLRILAEVSTSKDEVIRIHQVLH
jgi:hypothetical protein